jgi:septal ring factor EnvC (AmiA/AmiB activator)
VVSLGLAVVGLLVALAAIGSVRRLSRRLDVLNQSYWELRYDYTRLRSQVARLDPEQAEARAAEAVPEAQATVAFVPLSTIRKKDR